MTNEWVVHIFAKSVYLGSLPWANPIMYFYSIINNIWHLLVSHYTVCLSSRAYAVI